MRLLVQPDLGVVPIISAINRAKQQIDIVIFRADLKELQHALEAAVARGVPVHALIAHTNRGGEKRLRKLEQELLGKGVTVSRTGDDLVRYHGKLLIIDRRVLYVLGFNFTKLDTLYSRSFGLVTAQKRTVAEAIKVFEADATRQPYVPGLNTFVVSPENSRAVLAAYIKGARKELLIYDPKISDGPMTRLLLERAKSGVQIRMIGKMTRKHPGIEVGQLPKLRLHVRAILRDNRELFVGSQSLRQLELDGRREVGVIVHDASVIRAFKTIFEADWITTGEATVESAEGRKVAQEAEKVVEKLETEVKKEAADVEPALVTK
jgi:phosphatidylserine/phosphatidylglycerophosphate/cardiolipin synthase-like enzyme